MSTETLGVCCASRAKPQEIADQAIFALLAAQKSASATGCLQNRVF
jgi:hypothetical protein